MDKFKVARQIVVWSASGATMCLCLQIILVLGVEEKSLFQIFADIIAGGTVGVAIGVGFFLIFGAVGWVSGAIYGAFGLFTLMLGGALGGFGVGSLIHIVRNPNHYNYNIFIIFMGGLVTVLLVKWVSGVAGRLYDEHGPSLALWVLKKTDK